jgi:hypothetical protein
MKIKFVPLAITVIVSIAVLFGGWHLYRDFAVEKPLNRVALSANGVQSAETVMTNEQVVLNLKLDANADLADIYRKLKREGATRIGDRKLTLNVKSATTGKLEEAWRSSLLDVAESMENRRYSGIREAMEKLSDRYPGIEAAIDLDEDNVYIRLKDGTAAKYILLPRQPATLEVWSNA